MRAQPKPLPKRCSGLRIISERGWPRILESIFAGRIFPLPVLQKAWGLSKEQIGIVGSTSCVAYAGRQVLIRPNNRSPWRQDCIARWKMIEKNLKLVVFDMAGTTVRDDGAVNRGLRELPEIALGRHSHGNTSAG